VNFNPDDYMVDSQNRLVPKAQVAEIDQLRDRLVLTIVNEAIKLAEAVQDFKARTNSEIDAFLELSANEYNHTMGGEKGNVTLPDYAGRYRVVRAVQDFPQFDERLQVARSLIKDCLDEWMEGSRAELRTVIEQAFEVNHAGRVSVARIMGLRKIQIDHPKWKAAMEAIADSVTKAMSKTYIRVYQRNKEGEYDLIPLDGSSAFEPMVYEAPTPPREDSPELVGLIEKIKRNQEVVA
jgi:hypothetical protein